MHPAEISTHNNTIKLSYIKFLGAFFKMGGGGLNLLELCYKLEIWYVSTHVHVVSENVPFSTKTLLILLMSAFFAKIVPLLKAMV